MMESRRDTEALPRTEIDALRREIEGLRTKEALVEILRTEIDRRTAAETLPRTLIENHWSAGSGVRFSLTRCRGRGLG